jgi:cell division protease FtsH
LTKFSKNIALVLLVVLSLLVFVNLTEQVSQTKKALTFSEFLDHLDKGEVESVVIEGQALSGKLKGEAPFQAYAPQGYDLVPKLRA